MAASEHVWDHTIQSVPFRLFRIQVHFNAKPWRASVHGANSIRGKLDSGNLQSGHKKNPPDYMHEYNNHTGGQLCLHDLAIDNTCLCEVTIISGEVYVQ